MKLVDLDAEINRTCNEVCGHDRYKCKWAKYAIYDSSEEACSVIRALEKAVPVEAIPVEWLEEQRNRIANIPRRGKSLVQLINGLLAMWQKEQNEQEDRK